MKTQIAVTTRFKESLDSEYLSQLCTVLKPWGDVVLLLDKVEQWRNEHLGFSEIMGRVCDIIRSSDVLVADVSEPGYGIAAEVGMAYAMDKVIVMFSITDTELTESVISLATLFRRVNSLEELTDLMRCPSITHAFNHDLGEQRKS